MTDLNCVTINLMAAYRLLWVPLAAFIKDRYGCYIVGICQNEADKNWFAAKDKSCAIDEYVVLDIFNDIYGKIKGPIKEVYEKAQVYEGKYNCVYPELIQTDRHLGRGYSALGIGHSRSELSQKSSYPASIDFLNKIFSFWEDFFSNFKPNLAIGGGSGIIGKPFALVTRKCGVRFRVLMYAKYKNYFYWANDEFASFPGFESHFYSLKRREEPDLDKEYESYMRHLEHLANYTSQLSRLSPFKTGKQLVMQIAYHVYRKIKGIRTYGNYLLMDLLKEIILHDTQHLKLIKKRLKKAKDIKNEKYFFFPLQTEPEMSMTTFSPEFNEQLAVIELIAKALPSSWYLVVKEHPLAIARRPNYLYKLLLQIPNVLFVDFRENSLEIARQATAIVTISGTIGYEATILGKPVIAFGKHNWHNFMQNTILVDSLSEIKNAVKRAIQLENDEEDLINDGRIFLKTIVDKAFEWDFNIISLESKKEEALSKIAVETVGSALAESLDNVKCR